MHWIVKMLNQRNECTDFFYAVFSFSYENLVFSIYEKSHVLENEIWNEIFVIRDKHKQTYAYI